MKNAIKLEMGKKMVKYLETESKNLDFFFRLQFSYSTFKFVNFSQHFKEESWSRKSRWHILHWLLWALWYIFWEKGFLYTYHLKMILNFWN